MSSKKQIIDHFGLSITQKSPSPGQFLTDNVLAPLSLSVADLAKAIAPSCKLEIIGIRPGEKLHEEMISVADAVNTIDLGKYYAILPPGDNFTREKLEKNWGKFKFIEK